MSLVTAMSLLLPFFFYVFIVNFKQISHLHLLLYFVSFVLSPEEATEVFFKKGVLEDYAILTGKHLCWSLFLTKL